MDRLIREFQLITFKFIAAGLWSNFTFDRSGTTLDGAVLSMAYSGENK